MKYSPQQSKALDLAGAWLNQCTAEKKSRKRLSKPFFYLAGYAGTGKSTLASKLAELQDEPVQYGAFTGKAAKVMRDNGCIGAATIHSLIYITKRDSITGNLKFSWNSIGSCREAGLIIIDECSMVNDDLAKDLLKYNNPILVLGDPGQLPPVKGAGYFTSGNPDAMLDEIHRQAADSGIIRLATSIRENNFKPSPSIERDVQLIKSGTDVSEYVEKSGALIVGKNQTRNSYNDRMRQRLGYGKTPYPEKGETLICLKNDKDLGIFNGEIWEVLEYQGKSKNKSNMYHEYRLISPEDKNLSIDVTVHDCFFSRKEKPFWKELTGTQEFDFGYVLTCHKSQGSQWDNVVVFDESSIFRDQSQRWLYTAVTRAAKNITLVF